MKGITVVLSAANTVYNLMDLLLVWDTGTLRMYREMQIQNDLANGQSAYVYIGDASMDLTSPIPRKGTRIPYGDYRTFRDDKPSIDPRHFYLSTNTQGAHVNILLLEL